MEEVKKEAAEPEKKNIGLYIDDLPYTLKKYASAIGIEALVKLSEAAGGKNIYIPKKENLLSYGISRNIKQDRANGASIKELEEKYQLNKRTVYKKLNE